MKRKYLNDAIIGNRKMIEVYLVKENFYDYHILQQIIDNL